MNSADPTPEPTEEGRVVPPAPSELDAAGVAAELVPDATTAIAAESQQADPSTARVVLPQPGLMFATALTTVPLLTLMVVGIVLSLVVPLVYVIVMQPQVHEVVRFHEKFQIILFPVGTFITLLVAVSICWLFFGLATRRKVALRGISAGQLICVLTLTVPLAVLASEVANCVDDLVRQFEADWLRTFREMNGEMFSEFVALPAWLVFLGGCLFPGLGEELYCRGLLSRGLVARYGVVGGTLLAAGLFGAMHLDPVQATGAFALGVGLQFVFLTTRSLAAPIVLHTLNNSLAFLTMRFADSYPIPGLTPTPDGSAMHVPITILAAAVLSAAALMAIMFQNRTRWQLPDGSIWSPGYVTAEIPDRSLGAVAVRKAVKPMFIVAAVVAVGLLTAALVAAHNSAVGDS